MPQCEADDAVGGGRVDVEAGEEGRVGWGEVQGVEPGGADAGVEEGFVGLEAACWRRGRLF